MPREADHHKQEDRRVSASRIWVEASLTSAEMRVADANPPTSSTS